MADQLALRIAADLSTATVTIDPAAVPPVDPELLIVKDRCLISFRLTLAASKRYVFAVQDPIVVTDPGTQFEPPVRRSDLWVTMLDKHLGTTAESFKYSINLVDRQTGQPLCIDPVIRNEE